MSNKPRCCDGYGGKRHATGMGDGIDYPVLPAPSTMSRSAGKTRTAARRPLARFTVRRMPLRTGRRGFCVPLSAGPSRGMRNRRGGISGSRICRRGRGWRRGAGQFGQPVLQGVVKLQDTQGLFLVLFGLRPEGFEEEAAPSRPVVVARNGEQAVVIGVAVGLEIGADVEGRPFDRTVTPQEQGHEHAAQAAIAVEKRVQRLEFGVENGELHEAVGGVAMHVALPCAHGVGDFPRFDGHEFRVLDGRSGRADPVGRATIFAGRLASPRTPESSTRCAARITRWESGRSVSKRRASRIAAR